MFYLTFLFHSTLRTVAVGKPPNARPDKRTTGKSLNSLKGSIHIICHQVNGASNRISSASTSLVNVTARDAARLRNPSGG